MQLSLPPAQTLLWPVGPEKLWVLWWLVLQVLQPWHGLGQEPVHGACLGTGASNKASWEAATCRKSLGSAHDADVALDRVKDGCSQCPSKGLSSGAEISDFQGWQSLFLFEHSEQLCKDLCCMWPSYSWNCQQPQKSAPSQRITESKSLHLTSSLAQDISVVILLTLSAILC